SRLGSSVDVAISNRHSDGECPRSLLIAPRLGTAVALLNPGGTRPGHPALAHEKISALSLANARHNARRGMVPHGRCRGRRRGGTRAGVVYLPSLSVWRILCRYSR